MSTIRENEQEITYLSTTAEDLASSSLAASLTLVKVYPVYKKRLTLFCGENVLCSRFGSIN